MTTGTAASRAKKASGAAARSEVNGRKKLVTVRGVKLKLEPTVKFRLLKDMQSIRRPDESTDLKALVGALERILGDEMDKVWDIDVKPGKDSLDEALVGLLLEVGDKVMTAYGISSGE